MKYCPMCGVSMEDEAVACPQCGERMPLEPTVESYETTAPSGAASRVVSPSAAEYTPAASTVPPAPKKKSKKGCVIALIVGGALLLLGAIGIVCAVLFGADVLQACTGTTSPTWSDTDDTVAFTVGDVTDGVYTNEWLGVRFDLTDTFPEYAVSDRENYGGNTCGYASVNEVSGDQFVVQFDTELPTTELDAERCLDELMEINVAQYEAMDLTVELGKKNEWTLAGRKYYVQSIVANGVMHHYTAVAVVDDRYVIISATSVDEYKIIRSYNAIEALD